MDQAGAAPPIGAAEFDYLRTLLRQRSAMVLDEEKTYLVEARLLPLARREGLTSAGALLARLRATPPNGLHQQVVEAMTINETSFFRDVHPFEALRQVVLPEAIRRRAAERRLSLWSAACSTGQEPYSMALLLRESFPHLAGWDVRILATDLSAAALEKARQGRYNQLEVNRGLPAPLLVRYFRRAGLDWQLAEDVRRAVEFRPLNLAGPWPALPPMDVVFLRNVLIYFDTDTKRRILGKVGHLLAPGGVLFLGGAETTLHLDDGFERLPLERCGGYRRKQG
jgi:chemotaxis protein methyltransferase CheR